MNATKSKEIFIAKNKNNINKAIFFKEIDELIKLAKNGKSELIREKLSNLVTRGRQDR